MSREAHALQDLLDQYKSERVVVLGTTCTGKSTFIEHIPGARDMDKLIFPLLSEQEAEYVSQTPWAQEIGETMTRLTKERLRVKPGEPVFGTVLLDVDRIVYLKISDELLHQRTASRAVSFDDAKGMQVHIEDEMAISGLPVVEFEVG